MGRRIGMLSPVTGPVPSFPARILVARVPEEVANLSARMDTLRALVVDDSPAMRRNLIYALSRLGTLECIEAQDGAEGLKKFRGDAFDLVLTDINMPLMDGLKLVSQIRNGGYRSRVPILVITTDSAAEDRERALQLGASAYLVKPIQARDVLDTVKGLLKLE